jgi:hypothetical protein
VYLAIPGKQAVSVKMGEKGITVFLVIFYGVNVIVFLAAASQQQGYTGNDQIFHEGKFLSIAGTEMKDAFVFLNYPKVAGKP